MWRHQPKPEPMLTRCVHVNNRVLETLSKFSLLNFSWLNHIHLLWSKASQDSACLTDYIFNEFSLLSRCSLTWCVKCVARKCLKTKIKMGKERTRRTRRASEKDAVYFELFVDFFKKSYSIAVVGKQSSTSLRLSFRLNQIICHIRLKFSV